MLDFLKKSKKEKELQAAREAERKKKEEERQKLAEQKAKIARHAEGGEKIRRALRNIDLENYEMLAEQKESKLSVETIHRYFQIVDNIESVLDDAMISDVDTVEIDQDIVQMIALFSIALESGNEKTATQLLKGIAEGVKFTRTSFIYSNEEQKEALARKRRKEINTLLLLGRCQEYIDRVQESLTQLETYTADLEGKKKAAEKEEKKLHDHDPNLPDKLTKARMKKETLTRQVQQYKNAVNAARDSRNKLKAAELLKGKKEENLQAIGEIVTRINLIAFGSRELFGNIAMEQLTRLHEDFKENEKAAENEMQRIRDFNQDVDVTIETMFQNEVRDEDLQNLREYFADIKAEKEEEDRRRKAETEQKRKEEEENRQRKKERQAEERRERHSEKHRDTIVQ